MARSAPPSQQGRQEILTTLYGDNSTIRRVGEFYLFRIRTLGKINGAPNLSFQFADIIVYPTKFLILRQIAQNYKIT